MEKKSNKKGSKKLKKYYYELIDIFLIYSKKQGDPPKGIYCLNGLAIEKHQDNALKPNGFDIFHRDKIYKTKTFYCPSEIERQKWLDHLIVFDK